MTMNKVTLTKEQWMQTADSCGKIAQLLESVLLRMGGSKEDAQDLQLDMVAAASACFYVANCAADKVIFAAAKGK